MPAKKVRKSPRKPKSVNMQPTAADIWARTRLLVEVLLEVMEREIRAPDGERSDQWARLFGTRDSAVVNLQKLVQLLSELQEHSSQVGSADNPIERVSEEEAALFADWMRGINEGKFSLRVE